MTNGQLTGTAKLFANGILDCRKWSWLFAPRQAVISQPTMQSPHTHLNVVVLGQEPHDWCILEAFPIVGQDHVLLVTKSYNSKMKICQQKVNISTWHDDNDMSNNCCFVSLNATPMWSRWKVVNQTIFKYFIQHKKCETREYIQYIWMSYYCSVSIWLHSVTACERKTKQILCTLIIPIH